MQAVHSNTNATNAIPTIQSSAAPRAASLRTETVPTTSQLRPIQNSAPKLPTPINIERLAYHLTGYPKDLYINYLITGFSKGFKINFHGSVGSNFSNNLFSTSQLPLVIEHKLAKEIDMGRIKGPFDSPPLDNFSVSPIGVVPKKAANEFRMIQHLSFPFGNSINDHIPKEFSSVQYASVDDAIRIIKSLGRGCAMAKCDVHSAFRIIPLHKGQHIF